VDEVKKLLTIAGSDSSGGAGIQADLKTFSAHGVFGMSVITAVTAQNTQGVFAVQEITPEVIAAQLDAIFDDIKVDAVKIGMVSNVATIEVIARKLRQYDARNIVVDPVMISKSGYHLLHCEAEQALLHSLLPLADLVTPNIPEAEVLTGCKIESLAEMEQAAKQIYAKGAKQVLVKGGHLSDDATDILYDGQNFLHLTARRIATKNTHGTGCTLSSAIAANIALGFSVTEAVQKAKDYVTLAIEHSLNIGKGNGPTHHFYELYRKAGLTECD
jgi:hydroxymethylpyrimidine/phosphomethylpyrimidine kinase